MAILDRYILKHFLINFLILFSVLFLFTCMVQLFINLERFVEAADLIEGSEPYSNFDKLITILWLVFDFYTPQLSQFFTYLAGFVTVGAMGFTLVQLHRNRELTALLAAGISLHRIVMPIIVAGLILSMLQFANRELIMPILGPNLLRDYGQLGQHEMKGFPVQMARDGQGHLFYAYRYYPDEQMMERVVIWKQAEAGNIVWRITADSATWENDGWTLKNGELNQMKLKNSLTNMSTVNPSETDTQTITHFASDLDPTTVLLRRYGEYRQMLNLKQIGELIENPGGYEVGDLIRIQYGRFAQVLINILTLVIALPFFMLREPKNLVVQTVICSALGLIAQISGALGVAVGFPGVPAAASAFIIPLLILLPLAVALMSTVET